MKNLALIFFTFLICTGVFAQKTKFVVLGDKAFTNADYFQAAYYYKMASDKTKGAGSIPFVSEGKARNSGDTYIQYQLAESYRLYRQYRDAGLLYKKILDGQNHNNYPLAKLWYGQCLRADGLFDDALKELFQFKSAWKGDKEFIAVADKEIDNCNFAKGQYAAPKPVSVLKMAGQWNAEAGDYALVKNGDDYLFTSSRVTSNNKTHSNNVYSASSQSAYNPAAIKFSADSSSHIEHGTPSVSPSGRKMYLTSWFKKGNKEVLGIYYSDLENNVWSPLHKLNNFVNVEGYNALQPSITADGNRLFFVSDRPGGRGGYDIWVSDLDGSGMPVNAANLGNSINTPLDEEAPYYDSVNKKLFFSSKGFTGLGGFDVFESDGDTGKWSVPVNLGYPINSSKDDLYYFPDPADEHKFYLSSDRTSDCCLNLFQLRYAPINIAGSVTDCDAQGALADIKVDLIDPVSNKTLKETATDASGRYSLEVGPNHSYKLAFAKTGYFAKSTLYDVKSENDTLVNADICLQAYKINKPVVIKNILYDYNSATLRPGSKKALDSIAVVMRENPRIKIEIGSHTDSIGNSTYNLNLSQQRAQSCVDYLVSVGIAGDRLSAKGYGKTMPIAPNSLPNGKDNPAGRQANRRTEFKIEE